MTNPTNNDLQAVNAVLTNMLVGYMQNQDRFIADRLFPGVAVDITERKTIETDLAETARALSESETRFRVLADAMPQMVWSTQPDGFHDYYNARWYEFTGVPVGSTTQKIAS